MADTDFHELIKLHGSGNIQFVWHVAGYPYAVCTTPTTRDALDDGSVSALAARKRIFGTESVDGSPDYYWATDTDATPIFPVLRQPGKQSWSIHESKGVLQGGDWSVELSDLPDTGHTWDHVSTQFRGLEGIHRIVQPYQDTSVAHGFLRSDFLRGKGEAGDELEVEEAAGTALHTAINAHANSRKLLWIGQECVCADLSTQTDPSNGQPDYNAIRITTNADGDPSRGIYRSREQDHFVDDDTGSTALVTEAPLSIVDKYCWLWAVPIDTDGTLLSLPVIVREGVVKAGIKTSKGRTTIPIHSPLVGLKTKTKIPNHFGARPARYIFSRETGASSTVDDLIYDFGQCPHLVIRECHAYSGADNTYTWYNKNIWLCDHGDSVEFDTYDEVIDAVLDELSKCATSDATAHNSQVSGATSSGTPLSNPNDDERVQLWFNYGVDDGILTMNSVSDYGDSFHSKSWITGPVAWVMGLGGWKDTNWPAIPWTRQDAINRLAGVGGYVTGDYPWFYYSRDTHFGNADATNSDWLETDKGTPGWTGLWLICGKNPTLSSSGDTKPPYLGATRWAYTSPYHYQFTSTWALDHPYPDTYFDKDSPEDTQDITDAKLYFDPETDISGLESGDVISVGGTTGTITATDDTGTYPNVTLSNGRLTANSGAKSPLWYGAGLYNFSGLKDDADWTNPFPSIVSFEKSLFPHSDDRWFVWKNHTMFGDSLSDIFRAILGESGGTIPQLGDEHQLTNIIGFTTEDDFTSFIDWDSGHPNSLDNQISEIVDGQYYRLSVAQEVNVHDLLAQELLLHGLSPILEWDATAYKFRMRFRKIGAINMTDTVWGGYRLDESSIVTGQTYETVHSDSWIFNRMEIKCNHDGKEFRMPLTVTHDSSYMQRRNEAKTLSIESLITQLPNVETLDPMQLLKLRQHFLSMLWHLSLPQPQIRTKRTIPAWLRVTLGRGALITDRAGRTPYDYEPELDEEPAYITGMSVDLGARGSSVDITARITGDRSYGWAPACEVTASSKASNIVTCSTITDNAFSASGSRKDMSWFDCIDWNSGTGYESRDCSCTDFAVIAYVKDDPSSNAPLNFTVYDVDTTAGTFKLADPDTATNANYTAWDTAKDYIVTYCPFDQAAVANTTGAMQSCQKHFVFYCDNNGTIGSSNTPARLWQ